MVANTSPPKGEEGKSSPVTRPAPEAAPPESAPGDAGYYWRCYLCGCLLLLSPANAVIIEAEQCAGIDHVVFCDRCIRDAVARMVDGAL